MSAKRTAKMSRQTSETSIHVELCLDGNGATSVDTGIGFFDHMLETLCKHAMFDATIKAEGDLHVDAHHLVEDVGIVLGKCIDEALGERVGIARFGYAIVPMDDALLLVSVDMGGRSFFAWDVEVWAQSVGSFDVGLAEEFFRALCNNARMNLHVKKLAGKNAHHIIEAAFKALAIAIRCAVSISGCATSIPSTKGVL
ncbi:MAG: imidazoleglycerol-phosphate dehydratase HisB [Armatimonadota bacterium]|nr:imidazoleglycerol-phosphate dehydratase HisB [Armatimonadota bacterium]MCX7778056.1 imidazoleglycerol-phosphate dehydratase HisB [Armatimonadota bacterium]MDW8026060.1 imidazoleglycerol-phosphate dehydratase HisB [Armatimonadota bacterium]